MVFVVRMMYVKRVGCGVMCGVHVVNNVWCVWRVVFGMCGMCGLR